MDRVLALLEEVLNRMRCLVNQHRHLLRGRVILSTQVSVSVNVNVNVKECVVWWI